jgi:hypothetical protein
MFTVKSVNMLAGLYSICLGEVPISIFCDDVGDIAQK